MKGELGTRRRGGDGKLISDLVRELEERAELGQEPRPDTAVLFALDRRGNAVTLERIDAEEATEEYLADTWGGGRFQVRMEGEGKYLGSINVRVAGAPGAAARQIDQGAAGGEPQPNPPQDDLRQMVAELHRQLAELRRPVDAAPTLGAPAEMMRMAGEMAMAMVAPMQAMMEAMAKAKPKGDGAAELESFLRGLELGREVSGGDGSGFGPLLSKAFDRLESLQGMASSTPAHGHPPAVGTPAPQVTTEPSHPYLPAIAPYAPQLVGLAAGRADPGVWAAVIEDRAPDLVDALRGATDASRSQLLDALVAHHPPLAPHRPWLDVLVVELVASDSEEPQDVRDPVD